MSKYGRADSLRRLELKKENFPQSTFRGRYSKWREDKNEMLAEKSLAKNKTGRVKKFTRRKQIHDARLKYLKKQLENKIERKKYQVAKSNSGFGGEE